MSESFSQYQRQYTWMRSAFVAVAVVVLTGQIQHLAAQDGGVQVPRVTITLVNECEIPARDAGMLARILIREGQTVTKSEVVAMLENEQQEFNLNAAKLNVQVAAMKAEDGLGIQSAQAQLAESRSGRRVKEVGLQIAKAEAESDIAVQVASADVRLRSLELERAKNARDSFKGSISETQLDRLKTAVEKGQLEIEQAKDEHRVRQLKPQAEQAAINQKDEEVRRFEAQVKQEEQLVVVAKLNHEIYTNELAVAKLKLEQRFMRAPFDGVIAKIEKQMGEWVEPGAPVARMIDLKTLRAEGFLPAEQAFADLVGKSVTIELGFGSSKRTIPGKVTFVSSEIDPINMQVRFHAEFDNSQMVARPGMSGSLVIK